jgi:GTP cyclohydrolase I
MNALVQSPERRDGIYANPRATAISEADVEAAIRTILSWIGEDPDRDGLQGTPSRMVTAFAEYFAGYSQDPASILRKTFQEIDGYAEMVVLRRIPFQSHCECHFAPIIGHAWVGYVPRQRVVGISKLARLVETYARRLQLQKNMTEQIANAINAVLKPNGVGVVIKATHLCMTARGIKKVESHVVTSHMLGSFRDVATRHEFLSVVNACLRD